jgi:peptidoglycan/LPS O-acetylase OafA/YrhL
MVTLYSKINTWLQQKIFNFDLLLGLRGIMAISVVFYHMFVPLETIKKNYRDFGIFGLDGKFAVIVFFILSGYLMFKLYLTDRYSLSKLVFFYKARINRILPLYWAVLLVVGFGLYRVFWNPENLQDFWKMATMTQYLEELDFVPIKYFWFSPTWSLVIEMQFYFIVPFLAWGLTKIKHEIIIGLGIISGVAYIFNQNLQRFGVDDLPVTIMQKSILWYLPIFLVGGLGAQLLAYSWCARQFFSKLTVTLPFLIYFLITNPIDMRLELPKYNTLGLLVPVCLAIILIFESFAWDRKPAKWAYSLIDILNPKKLLEMLGHLSYSVYMWHIIVVYEVTKYINSANYPNLSYINLLYFQATTILLVTLAISFISYKTIEKIRIFKY